MPGKIRLAEVWQILATTGWSDSVVSSVKHSISYTIRQYFSGANGHRKSADLALEPAFQAQKMASLGRLTGGVAHDFNNLLTVVLGNATALRVQAEARGDAAAVQRAETIEQAAERGGRLAGQMLAFSRRQILRPEIVSVYRVISAAHEALAHAAGEGARVVLHGEPGLWNCLVDPLQLESAIFNLVLNARDAMPVDGNITISCRNHRSRGAGDRQSGHASGNHVRIDVSDHGTGIPEKLREKVFEPFFTTKPIGQGSGLGLAQVHGFAGQSGGWVDLVSTVGQGTTISLFLPRADGPEAEPVAGDGNPKEARAPCTGTGQVVLVVEPDPAIRMTVCQTLSTAGYHAYGVADSTGAFGHLSAPQNVDALLIEARLPGGMSGVALARTARQSWPALCVLVTSSTWEAIPETINVPAGGGKFEFVMKPYRAADLVRILGAALTINTFSLETEQLLAETCGIPLPPVPPAGAASLRGHEHNQIPRHPAIRLGVMPFKANGSGSDSAFCAGLAEEITAAFARFRWITCLAPASIAVLADEPPQTGRWADLDLDFLVQGSFHRKGDRIRVALRLTNLREAGEMTWGRRFDGVLADVLNLEDRIASETAAQLAPELLVWETSDTKSRPRVNPTAYDMKLRAIPATYRLDEAGFREAGELLEKSLALDPSSADCHSWLAHWYLFSIGQDLAVNVQYATDRAEALSKRAVELDPDDARGLTVAGHVRAFLKKDAPGAVELHDRAIALNPNLAVAWCYSGLAHCYLGQHEEAIRRIEHAMRLSPHDPHGFFFDTALAVPLLLAGKYDASAQVARRARDLNAGVSSAAKILLAALGYLGANREAASVRKALLVLEPHLTLRSAAARSPLGRQEDLNCYVQGLRLAGIPEMRGRFMSAVQAS